MVIRANLIARHHRCPLVGVELLGIFVQTLLHAMQTDYECVKAIAIMLIKVVCGGKHSYYKIRYP